MGREAWHGGRVALWWWWANMWGSWAGDRAGKTSMPIYLMYVVVGQASMAVAGLWKRQEGGAFREAKACPALRYEKEKSSAPVCVNISLLPLSLKIYLYALSERGFVLEVKSWSGDWLDDSDVSKGKRKKSLKTMYMSLKRKPQL